ncbi:MAG: aminotransferase class I/II-fold pyridoxal phosphate-dependent enzyme, partial [Nitratireductor sp.]
MTVNFTKPFTQQEPIPEVAIERAVEILRGGRLHRYNTVKGETAEAELLEAEYAHWQGSRYCVAVASGGQAMQIALRAAGVKPGDKVLANAWTLAPVPGAIHAVGAAPVYVETGHDWLTDLQDLEAKAATSGARHFLLSHMRGHVCDMDEVLRICAQLDITLIEDCAHTMGAEWKGRKSGSFGIAGCFSTQTYKHINSGEGGLLTTDDAELAARAIILSGSYMLYARHGAAPSEEVFRKVRLETPNCSARIDNLRAAILRTQLPLLEDNIRRWNTLYRAMEAGLEAATGITLVPREQHEAFVGSSFQFHTSGIAQADIPQFIANCLKRGVEVKWFGASEPVAFTSRYDSWRYVADIPVLPKTLAALSTTCDLRL